MAYEKKLAEKRKAYILFKKGMQQKDIATKLVVTEKTVSGWCKEFKTEKSNTEKLIIELKKDVEALKNEVSILNKKLKKVDG